MPFDTILMQVADHFIRGANEMLKQVHSDVGLAYLVTATDPLGRSPLGMVCVWPDINTTSSNSNSFNTTIRPR